MRSHLKRSGFTTALFLFFATTAVLGQIPPSDASLTANPVYQKNCAKCHGKTAEGHRFAGPSLISPKIASISSEELRNTVTNGKGHVLKFRMPEFGTKLTSVEIHTLIEQIQELNRKQ
jgi:mono/diheme cytochrome c family protein